MDLSAEGEMRDFASAARQASWQFIVLAATGLLAVANSRDRLLPVIAVLAFATIAVSLRFAPARLWGPRSILALTLVLLVSLGFSTWFAGDQAILTGPGFVVAFVWLGLHQPVRLILLSAPIACATYALSLWLAGTPVELVGSALVLITVAALVGVVLANVVADARTAKAKVRAELMRVEEQGAELTTALEIVERHRLQLNGIVETVNVGLAGVEPDGTYTSMNPRHRQFLEMVTPDGHGGMAGQVGYVYAADNVTLLTAGQLPSLRATRGESFTNCTMWIGKDPVTRRAISASARPMFNGQGKFVGAVLSYHDITDLMTALRVKDEFVALVSHELRTPLTSVMGYLQLAGEHGEELPPEVVHYLTVASRNAERLLRLVTDLLSAGDADGSGMRLILERVDLSRLVQLTLDDVEQRIEVADLELHVAIEPDVYVEGDPGRLAQVVDNLLSNAVKYTLPGGAISVSLARRHGEVQLCVSDTGIGVSELDQEELFTKFFQARNATERAIPGIGLGLVISKAIIDAHGGTITLESQEDLGTSVGVTLPAAPDEPETLASPIAVAAS